MIRDFFKLKLKIKSRVLYVEVSEKYISMCVIDKDDIISNYINIKLQSGIIEDEKVVDSKYVEDIIKEYIITIAKKFSRVVLIVKVEAIMRFVNYPNIKTKKLASAVNYSLAEHLPIDLKLYTTDYRIINKNKDMIGILLVSVATDTIESYTSIFENLNINVDTVDIYNNFLSLYLGSKDKGSIIAGISQGEKIIIQFIKDGELSYIKENDYADIDRLFRVHMTIDGTIDIEKAYLPKDTKEDLINFLISRDVKIIYIENLFSIWEDKTLKARDFWNI